jgi:hypothetical protein
MRRLKGPVTVVVSLLALVDAVVGFHILAGGWPKRISASEVKPGVFKIHVVPIPFTAVDWLILGAIIAFHAILFYLMWKTWHASPVQR